MLADTLAAVLPAGTYPQANPGDADSTPLRRLAQRIARNREVLGLHYPSDSKAGRYLGIQGAQMLVQSPSFNNLIQAAKQEWL